MSSHDGIGRTLHSMEPAGVGPAGNPNATRRNWIVLVLAVVLLLFANGRNTIPAAAWLAALFLLRFVRMSKPGRGLLIAWLALSGVWTFQFRGMAPLPLVEYLVLAMAFGLVQLVPFVLDRLFATRSAGLKGTLLFPSAWVVTEYLVAEFSPYGSWGSWAYAQYENLVLLQIISVTGMYGVSFLIAWFATVGNWAWEREFAGQAMRRGALAFVLVGTVVLSFGGTRLMLNPVNVDTVRVASVTKPDLDLFDSDESASNAYQGTMTAEDIEELRRRANEINGFLLEQSEREARAGAKIVFWGESNGFALKPDEPALIERGAKLARENQIYLGMGVGVWNQYSATPLENKIVLIDPQGDVVLNSLKAIPVPGGEAAISARDDGNIKSVDTPYGRVGAAICFDMDFPALIAQAGRQEVDIMLVPSNDWREIDPWHSHMARLRGVEQGFNLVRHVSRGLSLAADHTGRVIASMDHFTTKDRVLVAHVPTRGVRTVYSQIGDVFAWLCMGCVAVSTVSSWRNSRRNKPDKNAAVMQ